MARRELASSSFEVVQRPYTSGETRRFAHYSLVVKSLQQAFLPELEREYRDEDVTRLVTDLQTIIDDTIVTAAAYGGFTAAQAEAGLIDGVPFGSAQATFAPKVRGKLQQGAAISGRGRSYLSQAQDIHAFGQAARSRTAEGVYPIKDTWFWNVAARFFGIGVPGIGVPSDRMKEFKKDYQALLDQLKNEINISLPDIGALVADKRFVKKAEQEAAARIAGYEQQARQIREAVEADWYEHTVSWELDRGRGSGMVRFDGSQASAADVIEALDRIRLSRNKATVSVRGQAYVIDRRTSDETLDQILQTVTDGQYCFLDQGNAVGDAEEVSIAETGLPALDALFQRYGGQTLTLSWTEPGKGIFSRGKRFQTTMSCWNSPDFLETLQKCVLFGGTVTDSSGNNIR